MRYADTTFPNNRSCMFWSGWFMWDPKRLWESFFFYF